MKILQNKHLYFPVVELQYKNFNALPPLKLHEQQILCYCINFFITLINYLQKRRAIEALEARAPSPPQTVYTATLVNSLQNRVNSITLCITLNANTKKIVLVTLCIQIEWLFYVFGVKLSHESGADSTGHGSTCPHVYNDWARGHRE